MRSRSVRFGIGVFAGKIAPRLANRLPQTGKRRRSFDPERRPRPRSRSGRDVRRGLTRTPLNFKRSDRGIRLTASGTRHAGVSDKSSKTIRRRHVLRGQPDRSIIIRSSRRVPPCRRTRTLLLLLLLLMAVSPAAA